MVLKFIVIDVALGLPLAFYLIDRLTIKKEKNKEEKKSRVLVLTGFDIQGLGLDSFQNPNKALLPYVSVMSLIRSLSVSKTQQPIQDINSEITS
jgi:hypothetical protein